ncbi:12633_t:CDS:2, partial [Racocetra fulgida]
NVAPTKAEVLELQGLSRVENTDKCTFKIKEIESLTELDDFLYKFLTWLKRIEGKDYKAKSIHNCYASVAWYLKEHSEIKPCKLCDLYHFGKALRTLDGKMKKLQNEGLGEMDQASQLTADEIFQILNHETMQVDTNEALKRNKYEKSSTRKIPIPSDQVNNCFKPIENTLYLISFHPDDACESFFLETTRAAKGLKLSLEPSERFSLEPSQRSLSELSSLEPSERSLLEPSERSSPELSERPLSELSQRSSQRLFQKSAKKPSKGLSHRLKSTLYALFKPPYKISNDQPTHIPPKIRKSSSAQAIPAARARSSTQARPPLNDLSNRFSPLTYQDIKDINNNDKEIKEIHYHFH